MKKIILLVSYITVSHAIFAQTFVSTNPENKNIVLEELT